jgi:hypothetical protein
VAGRKHGSTIELLDAMQGDGFGAKATVSVGRRHFPLGPCSKCSILLGESRKSRTVNG